MPPAPIQKHVILRDPLKDATIGALKQVLDPLVDLMFDAGVTVHDFGQLVRERAVRVAVRRVLMDTGRASKSRAAIMTGLPRSEIARIIASNDALSTKRLGQHPARKVLAAWYDTPRFLGPNGEPAVLPIFGKGRTFEKLVSLHSGGIPVRAMLDELTKLDAIERLANQRVKARCRIPVSTGFTQSAIDAIGERTRDLLDTLISNLRRSATPLFEGTALLPDADVELLSLIRREIAGQGENFITNANALLNRSRRKTTRLDGKTARKIRVGVTVYFFQDKGMTSPNTVAPKAIRQRKNLRRQQQVLAPPDHGNKTLRRAKR